MNDKKSSVHRKLFSHICDTLCTFHIRTSAEYDVLTEFRYMLYYVADGLHYS